MKRPSVPYSLGELSVDEVGFIQTATLKALTAVASGKLDLNRLALEELASRGMNHQGVWVGFEEAKKILNEHVAARPALVPSQDAPDSDYVLSNGHRGCWVTVENVSVHIFKPPSDDRVLVELLPLGSEEDVAIDSATALFEDWPSADAGEVVAIPGSARDWLLYTGMEGSEEVAQLLSARLHALLCDGSDAETVRASMHELMNEHRAFGAFDTVSRELLERIIKDQIPSPRPPRPR